MRKRSTRKSKQDFFDIPTFLLRKNWTEEDWKRSEESWDKIQRETRERQQEAINLKNKQIFARARRARKLKVLKEHRREERKMKKLERRGRRVQRDRINEEHDGMIIGALRRGDETVGQISKRTELPTKMVRRSLKRLVKKKRVAKISGRRYQLIDRKRKHLSIEAKQRLDEALKKPKRKKRR